MATTMTAREIMTPGAECAQTTDTVSDAARKMKRLGVGALPICGEDNRLHGMITDRDITVRSVAVGQNLGSTKVTDVMSTDVRTCTTDQSVEDVLNQMADVQVRRIPVLDDSGQIVGIVSLGDVATKHSADVDRTLDEISSPSEPDR